jgi:hypothetical protein
VGRADVGADVGGYGIRMALVGVVGVCWGVTGLEIHQLGIHLQSTERHLCQTSRHAGPDATCHGGPDATWSSYQKVHEDL